MKAVYKQLLFGLGLLLISISCYAKMPSAGILPYAYNEDGVICVFLGEEPNREWADFGGKADPHEKYSYQTAAREFSEETRYVYGRYSLLKHHKNKDIYIRPSALLKESKRYIMRHLREKKLMHPKGYYVMYLAHVDYIPAKEFTCAPKVPHYEKRAYKWVPAVEFLEELNNVSDRNNAHVMGMKLRPPFYDTVMHNYDAIKEAVHKVHPMHSKHRTVRAAHKHS